MIDTPWITETTAQVAATIHLTIPRSEIQSAMGPALMEIFSTIKAQAAEPNGPWFTHHLKMNPAQFDFEVCVPVSAPVSATGRVVYAEFPVVLVARTIHHGPYDGASGLGAAWGEFGGWISANGHVAGPDLYERYLVGPDSNPDPGQWRTELSRPIIR